MQSLLKIHWMALHPVKVLSIVLGIVCSFSFIELAGRFGDVIPEDTHFVLRYFRVFEGLVQGEHFSLIALVTVGMCCVWVTIGGAATRRIALDILGGPHESFFQSIRYCLKWQLVFPSALAVACFYFILLARIHPWLMLFLLPTWLYAGLYYGALALENISLGEAAKKVHGKLRRLNVAFNLQARYLVSFALSTGFVYLVGLTYSLGIRIAFGHLSLGRISAPFAFLELVLIVPVLVYAAGYTTANLKSLQVFLYLNLGLESCSPPVFTKIVSSWLPSRPRLPEDSVRRP